MNDQKIKKYESWHRMFLILGSYGLLDIVAGVIMKQSGSGFEGGFGLTVTVVQMFVYLFGTGVVTSIFLFSIMIISIACPAWFCASEILRHKIVKLKKEKDITGVVLE